MTAADASAFAPFTPREGLSTADRARGPGQLPILNWIRKQEEFVRRSFVGARVTRVSAILLSAAAFACGGSGSSASTVTGPPPPPPVASGSTTSLMVTNNHYSPKLDSVAVGAMLTWTWNSCTGDGYGGSMCTSHSVKFDDGPHSDIQSSGEFSRMFADTGTFTYHCAVHGTAMSGTIVVH